MPIKVLEPEVISKVAAREMVENTLDSLTPPDPIAKLYELKRMAQEQEKV